MIQEELGQIRPKSTERVPSRISALLQACGMYLDKERITRNFDTMNQFADHSTSDPQSETQTLTHAGQKRKILVFSPDRDLAKSLSLLFENHFDITCETSTGNLGKLIAAASPDLLIVDLHTFSSDVMLELSIVEANCARVPVVILRAYNRLRADVEEMVQRTAKVVFYKPFNAEEVVQSIHRLMAVNR